jgi:hypothetical protein
VKVLPRHALFPVAVLAAALMSAACGGPPSSSSPTPSAAPSPTPDTHLKEPARADVIYSTLVERGLQLVGTNASRGSDPVAVINATYGGWPLVFVQYRSAGTRQQRAPVKPGEAPRKGDPPFTFAGLNMIVQWGPKVDNRAPRSATKTQLDAATKLAAELDRLIGPLVERSTQPVAPKPAPTRPAVTPRPAATPRPTKTP